ncbi:patatin-like phospholipase family protein [Salinimonas sediminis]|uniref:Patatin-like phospholipase family protein n=1 Tax=Salinimonas sediminis TaxID=2303538 RepID=A0A346NKV3_9ALTE|nr:patatin-like phospholipase family protein [Salinimonas sediminis]AXR06160.1 patatin-like phospholipase family protein [Salinimonas sediminis]
MSAPLEIYAGPGATKTLQQYGFYPLLFNYFIGASGGPKWFVLAGLDRVLFPDYFQRRGGQIQIIGSSAGAFRAACMVQRDPLAAINRLAESYAHTTYSPRPTSYEITAKAKELLAYMLGDNGLEEILTNERFKAHIITARCQGLVSRAGKLAQLAGLAMSAAHNRLGRQHLQKAFTRVVFSAPQSKLDIIDPYDLKTERAELGYNNIQDVLLASGSIPMVLDGVENIGAAPPGVYRDGGIIDYHFDLSFGPHQGLTLYPHFYPRPVTGWFDKRLPKRLVHQKSYDNVVMLVPSPSFVASLPYSKIPDRNDFKNMDAPTRIKYWNRVLSETDRLGEYFMSITEDGSIMDKLKPLPFACN